MPLNRTAKKVANPDFIDKEFDCPCCGGRFKVTKRTTVNSASSIHGGRYVRTRCPYCDSEVDLQADPHKQLRDKLSTFIHAQVAPIKSITDEKVRLPMQHLLDDINKLVEED